MRLQSYLGSFIREFAVSVSVGSYDAFYHSDEGGILFKYTEVSLSLELCKLSGKIYCKVFWEVSVLSSPSSVYSFSSG